MKLVPTAIAVAAVVILLLLWKYESDARRDGKIEMLTKQVTRDSIVVDSLVVVSSIAEAKVLAAIDHFAKKDTVWRRHSDTVTATVDRIVHDTTADSTKIRELAGLVEETKVKADSAVKAAEAAVITVQFDLMAAFSKERSAWSIEREHRAEETRLLKKQSRHWGLCGATIYGVKGMDAGVGLCYRY